MPTGERAGTMTAPAPDRGAARRRSESGFTLLELLIVVAIIGILAGIAVAQLRQTPQMAKEAVLKQDLFVLRDLIDQYFADKGKYPDSLQTLVDDGYIRALPVDPITESDQTWVEIYAEASDDDPEGGGASTTSRAAPPAWRSTARATATGET